VAYQRADADAEGAEQGSDGQVAPQHAGDAAGDFADLLRYG
jgi:hypothetical protein